MPSRNRRRPASAVPSRPQRVDRKTLQLCGQVAHTLNLVLGGELDDDVLRNVYVESVRPAPDASRLLVAVAPMDPRDETPPEVILQRLGLFSPRIRSEVAASITRRKTPELSYMFVRPDELHVRKPEGGESADDEFGDEAD